MQFTPKAISLPQDDTLRIEWNDDLVGDIPVVTLREQCPCATCREKRKAKAEDAAAKGPAMLQVLDPREAQPTRIEGMRPVGNYAYAIAFNDGHDTGIFTLEFLRALSESR